MLPHKVVMSIKLHNWKAPTYVVNNEVEAVMVKIMFDSVSGPQDGISI